MGDRCYMEVRCKKLHAPIFEKLGFKLHEEGYDGHPELVELADEQANYAHGDRLPMDIPYFGWHTAGGEYGAEAFACDGRKYFEVGIDVHSGGMVVHVSDAGVPDEWELGLIRMFRVIEKRAKKALGLLGKKVKAHVQGG